MGAARASSGKRERGGEDGRSAATSGKKQRVEPVSTSGGSGRGGGTDGQKGTKSAKGKGGEEASVEEGAGDGKYPFEVDLTDHAETPAEAYTHIAPVLSAIAGPVRAEG